MGSSRLGNFLKVLQPKELNMEKIFIREKLEEIGVVFEDLILGDFDMIGEHTAKKSRSRNSDLYKSVGAFFRPNYERGMLIYSLIKKYEVESFLEIGFGRGYGTLCAAMAMFEMGKGTVTTIDPALNEEFLKYLQQIFPQDWFSKIKFVNSTSQQYFANIEKEQDFDFVYIDGDHTYEGVKHDWENTKERFNKFLLFDDYHMPSKKNDGSYSSDIECARLIDEIEDETKQLIIMDRRIFFDDRGYKDSEVDYGQVLISRV